MHLPRTETELLPVQAPPGSLSEYVVDALRRAISDGDLAPGEELAETDLASNLGVSRGPVREALALLAREGLVELRRHRSARVVQLTLEDAEEVFTLRLALERLAAARAAEKGPGLDLTAMDAALARLDDLTSVSSAKEAATADLAFHDAIYAASGHARLQRAWATLRPQVYMFLLARNHGRDDFADAAHALHGPLRDVIAAGDAQRAMEAVETHLRGAFVRLTETLTREQTEAPSPAPTT